MDKFISIICSIFCLCLVAGTASADGKTEINAASGNQGGVFYVGMGAIGKAIMQDNPDIDYTMFPSAGLSNVLRVQKGQSQIGVVQSNNAHMAVNGTPPLKAKQDKVLGLANVNTKAHTHIVVRADSEIKSIEEIRDKKLPVRININPVGGNNELLPRRIFEEYGIGWKELRNQGAKLYPLSIPDSVDMMKDGRLDVDVYHGEEPAFKYNDIMSTTKIRILPVDEKILEKLATEYGGSVTEFSDTAYDGLAKGIKGLTTHTELIVNADMPEDLVYRITKAIMEHRDDIATAVPLWSTLQLETAPYTQAPLHPGAAKYYQEKGVLK